MVYEVCFRILCLFHLELRTWSHKVNSGIKTNTRTLPRPAFCFLCFFILLCAITRYQLWVIANRQSVGLISFSHCLSSFTLPVSPLSFRFAFAVRFAARSPAKWLRWADASHVLCQRRQRRETAAAAPETETEAAMATSTAKEHHFLTSTRRNAAHDELAAQWGQLLKIIARNCRAMPARCTRAVQQVVASVKSIQY